MGAVSAMRVLVGPLHTTTNSIPLTRSSAKSMEQVRVREEPIKMEVRGDDTITEEGARTMREMDEVW